MLKLGFFWSAQQRVGSSDITSGLQLPAQVFYLCFLIIHSLPETRDGLLQGLLVLDGPAGPGGAFFQFLALLHKFCVFAVEE